MISRRTALHATATLAGASVVRYLTPGLLAATAPQAAPGDRLTQMRQQYGAAPIASEALAPSISMLSGAGGNVILIQGKDGKVLVDGFVKTAWGNLQKKLDAADSTPIRALIDTHWHFDHADNNGQVRAAGGTVIAAENTRARLTQTRDILGMHFPAEPSSALPNKTFKTGLRSRSTAKS